MYDVINSRYTYKGTDVLINKLDIKDKAMLEKYEKKMVAFKLAAINEVCFPKVFDERRLKYIHNYLFCDVYDFAGIYRNENIIKDSFVFSQYEYIEENLKSLMKKVDIHKFKSLNFDDFLKQVSFFMTELNVIHPFREGNGRAIREYIRELMLECGYEIDFSKIDYNEILKASKMAILDDSYQIQILRNSCIKIDCSKKNF